MTADETREKLAHARAELAAAEDTRARIAGALHYTDDDTDDGGAVPGWFHERLTIELHAADLRVDLYRQVVAKLVDELGLRS